MSDDREDLGFRQVMLGQREAAADARGDWKDKADRLAQEGEGEAVRDSDRLEDWREMECPRCQGRPWLYSELCPDCERIVDAAGASVPPAPPGPTSAHRGDPCGKCGTPHDEVAVGPCPGPRFGERVRKLAPRIRTAMGQWPDRPDLEALAAEIDADRDELHEQIAFLEIQHADFRRIINGQTETLQTLRQRIEAAVERWSYRELEGEPLAFPVVGREPLLAALAEIFGERPAEGSVSVAVALRDLIDAIPDEVLAADLPLRLWVEAGEKALRGDR